MIISRFKDYYDYLEHIYGKDDRWSYKRDLLRPINKKIDPKIGIELKDWRTYILSKIDKKTHNRKNKFLAEDELYNIRYYITYNKHMDLQNYIFLIIAGKLFIIRHINENPNLEINNNSVFFSDSKLLEININHKSPICVVQYGFNRIITKFSWFSFPMSPILEEIPGFVKYYPPEQIYQDIDYFMSNQVNTNADIAIPVQVNEKDRYEMKGFDRKRSFRPKIKS